MSSVTSRKIVKEKLLTRSAIAHEKRRQIWAQDQRERHTIEKRESTLTHGIKKKRRRTRAGSIPPSILACNAMTVQNISPSR